MLRLGNSLAVRCNRMVARSALAVVRQPDVSALAARCNRMGAHSALLRILASLLYPYSEYSLKGIMGVVVGLILIVFVLVRLVPIVIYPPYSLFITLLQFW